MKDDNEWTRVVAINPIHPFITSRALLPLHIEHNNNNQKHSDSVWESYKGYEVVWLMID